MSVPGEAFYDEMFDRDRIVLHIYVFYVVTGAEVWYPYSGTLIDNDIVTNKFSNIVYIDQVMIYRYLMNCQRIQRISIYMYQYIYTDRLHML